MQRIVYDDRTIQLNLRFQIEINRMVILDIDDADIDVEEQIKQMSFE